MSTIIFYFNKKTIVKFFVFFQYLAISSANIGCYKCSTLNNDIGCVDPFNPGSTNSNYYEPDCYAGLEKRVGIFPARYCLKVSGRIADTDEQLVIRTCTINRLLDSDSTHSSFTLMLNDKTSVRIVSGLIASCEADGCNMAFNKNNIISIKLIFCFLLITFLI